MPMRIYTYINIYIYTYILVTTMYQILIYSRYGRKSKFSSSTVCIKIHYLLLPVEIVLNAITIK